MFTASRLLDFIFHLRIKGRQLWIHVEQELRTELPLNYREVIRRILNLKAINLGYVYPSINSVTTYISRQSKSNCRFGLDCVIERSLKPKLMKQTEQIHLLPEALEKKPLL